MKNLALILASLMILGAVAVNAQDKTASKPAMKDTTHMKSKKAVPKKSAGNYQMKKKEAMTGTITNEEQMEDPSKIKSTGKPVYKK
jgi:hypothetical protein